MDYSNKHLLITGKEKASLCYSTFQHSTLEDYESAFQFSIAVPTNHTQ